MTSVAGSVRLPTFWTVVGISFAVGALYPVALGFEWDFANAARWFQNDVAYSIFVLWVFPLIAGLLWVSILPGVWQHLSASARHLSNGVLVVLCACSLVVVASDAARTDDKNKPMLIEPG